MLKIKPIRGALALLLAVSLCLAMSLTAFLIDTPAMRAVSYTHLTLPTT